MVGVAWIWGKFLIAQIPLDSRGRFPPTGAVSGDTLALTVGGQGLSAFCPGGPL